MKTLAVTTLLLLLLAGCDFDMKRISKAYTDYVTRGGGAWAETGGQGSDIPPMRLTFRRDRNTSWWESHRDDTVDFQGVWAWARKSYVNGRGRFEIAGGKEEPVTIAIELVARPFGPEDDAYMAIVDTAGDAMKLVDRKGIQHFMHRMH